MSDDKKELTPRQELMESYAACLKTSKNSSLRTYDIVEKNENDFFAEIIQEGYDPKEIYNALLESGQLTDEEVGKVSIAYSNLKKKLDESAEQLDEIDHSLPREERLKILAQKVDRHRDNMYNRGSKISERGRKQSNKILAPIDAKYADWWYDERSGKHIGQLRDEHGDGGETQIMSPEEHAILDKFGKSHDRYSKLSRPFYWSGTRWSGAQDQLNPANHRNDGTGEPKNWPKHDYRVGGMHKYLGANKGAPRGNYYSQDGRKWNPKNDKFEEVPSRSVLDKVKYYVGKIRGK